MEIIEAACESAQTNRCEKIREVKTPKNGAASKKPPPFARTHEPARSPASRGTIAAPFRRWSPPRNAMKKRIPASASAGKNARSTNSATRRSTNSRSNFDLIVIDHPWAGFAFEKNLVLDLKPLLPPAVLNDCAQNSIGATFESYCYGGRLLALPIDAAAPAPSWRPDLLERAGVSVPATWPEAVALARRKLALIPGFQCGFVFAFSDARESARRGTVRRS